MNIQDVLCINTYAGSLLLAAKKVGLPIRGTYEDSGFGSKIQAANFPDVPRLEQLSQWPKQDLSRTIVLAHPPCAGFSLQNKNNGSKTTDDGKPRYGLESNAFQCTLNLLEYAMDNGAAAVLVESVVPALEGGRELLDAIAVDKGYSVYRVLQNACDFGVPQRRPRYWAIAIRDRDQSDLLLNFKPRSRTVSDVLGSEDPDDEPIGSDVNRANRMLLVGKAKGYRRDKLVKILNGDHGPGKVETLLKKVLKLEDDVNLVRKEWTGRGYSTASPRILDGQGTATTMMSDNLWIYNGQPLTPNQYKMLMGFPAKYQIPRNQTRMWLSKGVCPPVAEFMLRSVWNNLEGCVTKHNFACAPGETIDLSA